MYNIKDYLWGMAPDVKDPLEEVRTCLVPCPFLLSITSFKWCFSSIVWVPRVDVSDEEDEQIDEEGVMSSLPPKSDSLRDEPMESTINPSPGPEEVASPPGSLWCFFLCGLPLDEVRSSTERCWVSLDECITLKIKKKKNIYKNVYVPGGKKVTKIQ